MADRCRETNGANMTGVGQRGWRRAALVAVALGAVVGGLGVTGAVIRDEPPAPGAGPTAETTSDATRYSDAVAPQGEGMEPEEAISRVLRILGSDIVTAMEPVGAAGSTWLTVYEKGDPTLPGSEVRLTWLAALAQGAVADLVRTDQVATNQVVRGSSVIVTSPSGRTRTLDGGVGYVAAGQVFDGQVDSRDDRTIVDDVDETLRSHGLSPVSVQVLHPLGPAVSVVATLSEGTEVNWTIDDLREAISGDPKAFEGLLIEIDSPSGAPLLVTGVAYRTGLGGTWFAEGQDVVFGVVV
ncbi:MAG: hypothetical protein JWO76_808 [Nocardioides sp.]|nr:hypothetical protein [Nocardioides sp.]